MTSLVQLIHPQWGRRVARVSGDRLDILESPSAYSIARFALEDDRALIDLVSSAASSQSVSYDEVYVGSSDWSLLPAFDHPDEPARCLVAGTGLTHMASAANRQAMHEQEKDGGDDEVLTDSMRMFRWGVEGGRPDPGTIGVAPEWFYKGPGSIVRAHGDSLDVPSYADDGGEEPEIAGCYLIDDDGTPRRLGFAIGNEFADHVMEKKNYLYLAPSKLRDCALGPELVLDGDFGDVHGTVHIERGDDTIWSRTIVTGEANMSHSLANLEHHHFKYAIHRRPGDAHIHFYGADGFSFGEGVALENGDVMAVAWEGFGRALRNPLRIDADPDPFVPVLPV